MSLLKQILGLSVEFEKAIKEAEADGHSAGYDTLENEVAEALGAEGANVDRTVAEHVLRIRMQRDRLVEDGDRMDWLQHNQWFITTSGGELHLRKAIDKEMAAHKERET